MAVFFRARLISKQRGVWFSVAPSLSAVLAMQSEQLEPGHDFVTAVNSNEAGEVEGSFLDVRGTTETRQKGAPGDFRGRRAVCFAKPVTQTLLGRIKREVYSLVVLPVTARFVIVEAHRAVPSW